MAAGRQRETLHIPTADPTWREVKAYAEDRLVMHRRSLESIGMPHEDTEGVRHAIAELEALLKFSNPSKMSANVSDETR